MLKKIAIINLLVGICLLLATQSWASFSSGDGLHGSIGLTYGNYERQGGSSSFSASSFSQQYSLLWHKSALLKNGRAGYYNIGVGAEWVSFDTTTDTGNFNESRFKPFYLGRLLLAPGGLPFRLFAYSEDTSRASLVGTDLGSGGSMSSRAIHRSIHNGTHMRSGLTLEAGIRNGSYLGRFREIMSTLPRILLDFSEEYVRDVNAETPQHYRVRDLAFISLNKKDNWFHYRFKDYTDYNNSRENFTSKTYMLGTVDHLMKRQWVNLTNWLKFSTDLTYQTVESNSTDAAIPYDSFTFNLYSQARRNGTYLNNFTSFRRSTNNTLAKSLQIPFYGGHRFDPDSSANFAVLLSADEESVPNKMLQENKSAFGRIQGVLNQTSRWLVSPKLEIEHGEKIDGSGAASRFGFELYSNPKYRRRTSALAGFSIGYWSGQSDNVNPTISGDTNFTEGKLYGRVSYRPDPFTNMNIRQAFRLGVGEIGHIATRYTSISSGAALESNESGTEFSSDTRFGISRYVSRWFNVSGAVENLFLTGAAGTRHTARLSLDMRYQKNTFRAAMKTEYKNYLKDTITGSAIKQEFTTDSTLSYKPNRVWEHRGYFNYRMSQHAADSTYETISADQNTTYSIYSSRGLMRKLFDFEERLKYEWRKVNDGLWRFSLGGGMKYYVRSDVTLGASMSYALNSDSSNQLYYAVSAKVHRRQFQASVSYRYQITEATDSLAQIDERLLEVEVKRKF